MDIKLQFKNFAKLLLIGAILFTVYSTVSRQASECVLAKNEKSSQADAVKNMFVHADEQIKPESPGYVLVSGGCVKAAVPPAAITPRILAAITGDFSQDLIQDGAQKMIIEYEVAGDDTLSGLAAKFEITAESILWANNLAKGAVLKSGQKLIIPPVAGVIHYAVSGDTIAQIAKKYQAKIEDILVFNDLAAENDIFIGDVLMVPGGKIVPAPVKKPVASTIAQNSSQSAGLSAMPANYFLCPVGSACKKTQGLHFRNAVDLTAGYCGAPIYAAASGVVIKAKTGGWNGGAGNNITISHMGGTVTTHYYHLQTISVLSGQEVKKGDAIGAMGRTGNATGCHLHFEVGGAANPF